MPTRMVTYLRERTVYVAVLVEGPRRRRSSSTNSKFHHHHHIANGGGYNRKAQLLEYSRYSSFGSTKAINTFSSKASPKTEFSVFQIVAVKNKPKHVTLPTCMGNWKVVMPRFLGSFMSQNKKSKKKKKSMASKTNKIKAMVKSIQVQRKPGLFSKFFVSLRKGHR